MRGAAQAAVSVVFSLLFSVVAQCAGRFQRTARVEFLVIGNPLFSADAFAHQPAEFSEVFLVAQQNSAQIPAIQ